MPAERFVSVSEIVSPLTSAVTRAPSCATAVMMMVSPWATLRLPTGLICSRMLAPA